MQLEVENLRIQLGVPEDKSLFKFDVGVTDSSSDFFEVNSTISDSEFGLREPVIRWNEKVTKKEEENSSNYKNSISQIESFQEVEVSWTNIPRSISGVLAQKNKIINSDNEDEEELSVVQVKKKINEQKKEELANGGTSETDSSESGKEQRKLLNEEEKSGIQKLKKSRNEENSKVKGYSKSQVEESINESSSSTEIEEKIIEEVSDEVDSCKERNETIIHEKVHGISKIKLNERVPSITEKKSRNVTFVKQSIKARHNQIYRVEEDEG